jgi:hypothetical protein
VEKAARRWAKEEMNLFQLSFNPSLKVDSRVTGYFDLS